MPALHTTALIAPTGQQFWEINHANTIPLPSFFLALCFSTLVCGATAYPDFESYPAGQPSSAPLAKVHIVTARDKTFRTALKEAIGRQPNFAGHYVLIEIGCGASCVQAAAIDANTGSVAWLPFSVCCAPPEVQEPIRYRLTSSLIEVTGARDEKGGGRYFYRFTGKRFVLLKEIEGFASAPPQANP